MFDLLKRLNPFNKKEVVAVTDPVPQKYKLTKANAAPIAKAYGYGAAGAVGAFTVAFAMTSIEWGALAAFVGAVVPAAWMKFQSWLKTKADAVKPIDQ